MVRANYYFIPRNETCLPNSFPSQCYYFSIYMHNNLERLRAAKPKERYFFLLLLRFHVSRMYSHLWNEHDNNRENYWWRKKKETRKLLLICYFYGFYQSIHQYKSLWFLNHIYTEASINTIHRDIPSHTHIHTQHTHTPKRLI